MCQPQKIRDRIIQEALSWLGTPYAHAQRCKGAGVDCGQILAAIFEAVGTIPAHNTGAYPHDWHLHRGEERYLQQVERYAHKIDGPPEPGDIALYRWGRCISHGAIVIQWPVILHAYVGQGVILGDSVADKDLARRLVGFWSILP